MEKYLRGYETEEGASHTMLPGPTYIKNGKWKIENIEEFYKIYAKEYEKGYTFVERHIEKITPIVIDIDIKQEDERRRITEECIKEIIKEIYEEIRKFTKVKDEECYVMQRPEIYKTEKGLQLVTTKLDISLQLYVYL